MVSVIKHLSTQVPIVRSDGTPTPYFARLLEEISDAKIAASVIDAMGGDPDVNSVVVWDDAAGDLVFLSLSDMLDWIGDEHGSILFRGASGWELLAPDDDGKVLTTHDTGADPTWETPTTGGGTQPTVLATRVQQISSSNTVTASWPTGTATGDVVIVMLTHDNNITTPSGWTLYDNKNGSFISGSVYGKVMTSGDISTGSITVNFSASGNGGICLARIDPATTTGVRGCTTVRVNPGATPVDFSSTVPFESSDLIIGIVGNRGSSTNAMTDFTSFGTSITTNSSVFFGYFTGTLGGLGFTEQASFSSAGNGYYIGVIGLRGL